MVCGSQLENMCWATRRRKMLAYPAGARQPRAAVDTATNVLESRENIEPPFQVPAVLIESGYMDAGGLRLNRRARVETLRQALIANR
jgi:hypothetical protein